MDKHELARLAALEGFHDGISMAAQAVAEMAADEDSDLLREAACQIRSLPADEE